MNASLEKLQDLSASIEQLISEGNGQQILRLLDEWGLLFRQIMAGGALGTAERQGLIQDYTRRHEVWLERALGKRDEATFEIKRVASLRKNRKLVDRVYDPARSTGRVIRQSG
jgi:hypothetical protein